ncbi:hypothetical protein PILCRDRAFT_461909 [Piloderma croceum F 1598]|uniref:Uncharacterized protein n=1 Tax=Piloderma croceum (strain F 1598) TaxID=765440 RepID=A0A0C3FU55_PILCF|nr:hypothetical protein PILCRDRAFT_461909 [Piloderma croceum F 1598]
MQPPLPRKPPRKTPDHTSQTVRGSAQLGRHYGSWIEGFCEVGPGVEASSRVELGLLRVRLVYIGRTRNERLGVGILNTKSARLDHVCHVD